MNRTKSIFAAIGVSVIMSLLAACGGSVAAPSDVPMIADMKQAGGNNDNVSSTGKPLADNAIVQFIGTKFDTTGNFNWSNTVWASPKSIDETTAFYSQEALEAAGWNAPDMPGCTNVTSGDGVVCLLAKPSGDTFTVLGLTVAPIEGKVVVLLLRVEGMKLKAE